MNKIDIVISSGDPAGCGPIATLKAIKEFGKSNVNYFVVGDEKIYRKLSLFAEIKNKINFINLGLPQIRKVKTGKASKISGKASLEYLKTSLQIMKSKGIRRLVTAPLSKEAVKLVLPQFYGHTEYLAEYFKVKRFEMMFVSKRIKIVPLTRHIPLREVPNLIKKKFIFNSLSLIYSSLQKRFRITSPRIAFTSLNPHAGRDTFLEIEEKAICSAITKFPRRIYGPYPADTLFLKENLNKYDCIICLYHDQAMIPFKLLFWHDGVNITLGLPIIRTSPVHGVAYNIAGQQEKIDHSSMLSAIRLAATISL